jgi:hypothetical protein
MNFPDKSQYMYVRAVHGEESFPSFVDNGDGTVTDINTGLMWQQDGSKRIIWKDALAYCESLTLAEYDDWRLPDINELLSIADYSKPLPAIDTNFFPLTLIYYWSSTTNAQIPDESFQLCFGVRGRVEAHSKEKLGTSYVRAVRGGLYVPSGGDTCPAVVLLGKNDPRLETIRRFRDELLAKSAYGRKLIGFYYKNEKRLISVLEKNRIIKTTAKSVLETIVPAMKWLLN